MKRIVFGIFALILAGLVVYTSINTGDTYSSIGGWLGPWINHAFFFGKLNATEVEALVAFGGKFIGHFWLFAFQGLFTFLFLDTFQGQKRTRLFALVILGIVLASFGEIIQLFTPQRYPNFGDVLLNFSGYAFLPISICLYRKMK